MHDIKARDEGECSVTRV